jgi:hypothetical protein
MQLTEPLENFYEGRYRIRTHGINNALESFPVLQSHALAEIKRKFSEKDIDCLVECFGKEPLIAGTSTPFIIAIRLSESERVKETLTKKQVSEDLILSNITSLTSAQCYFLMERISRFNDLKEDKETLYAELC